MFQRVRIRHVSANKETWIPGTIVNTKHPNSFIVRIPGNIFAHADHLRQDDSEKSSKEDQEICEQWFEKRSPLSIVPIPVCSPALGEYSRKRKTTLIDDSTASPGATQPNISQTPYLVIIQTSAKSSNYQARSDRDIKLPVRYRDT